MPTGNASIVDPLIDCYEKKIYGTCVDTSSAGGYYHAADTLF